MGIDWYDGSESFVDSNAPSLAVGFSNGKVKIMKFGPIHTSFGHHLQSLKVPGSGINGLSWKGGELRIALIISGDILERLWYILFTKSDRPEHCVGILKNR